MIVQRVTCEIVDMTRLTRKEKKTEGRNNSLLFGRANLDATEKKDIHRSKIISLLQGEQPTKTMFSICENT